MLGFLEDNGDVLVPYLECETLGRLAAVSKRALALNRTGPLARRWVEALAALEKEFPVADVKNYEGFDWDDDWKDFANGGDPRINGMKSVEKAKATWEAISVMQRVATLIKWQSAVAEAVRRIPEDYDGITSFVLEKRDPRFQGHFDFTGYPQDEDDDFDPGSEDRCSPGMKLVLKLAYLVCCECDRCTTLGYTHAGDVFLNGWDQCCDFRDRCFFNDVLTGELWDNDDSDEDSDSDEDDEDRQRRERHRRCAISKHKAWFLSRDHYLGKTLAPLLGERIAFRHLTIMRGEDVDLPENWHDLFEADPDFDDDFPEEPVIVFLETFQWDLSNKKQRGLSRDEVTRLVNILRAKTHDLTHQGEFNFYKDCLMDGTISTFDFLESKIGRDAIPFVFEHIDAPDNPRPPLVIPPSLIESINNAIRTHTSIDNTHLLYNNNNNNDNNDTA